jgi:hypothetical protein
LKIQIRVFAPLTSVLQLKSMIQLLTQGKSVLRDNNVSLHCTEKLEWISVWDFVCTLYGCLQQWEILILMSREEEGKMGWVKGR